MKYTIKVADICFDVEGYEDLHTSEAFAPYICTDAKADVTIKYSITQNPIPVPSTQRLTDRLSNNWYSDGEGRYTIIFQEPDEDFVCARVDYDNTKKEAQAYLLDVAALRGTDDSVFLYNIMERIFRLALIFEGGFTVHASSVICDGFGVAFSAPSGTGKSTHTGLWLEEYPGAYILNDDAPAVRRVNGLWHIYGTPWAGTTGINRNSMAPLKGLVFLERSEVNTIRDMSAPEIINKLFEAIMHPVSDELMSIILSSVSSFMSECTICTLGCNISREAPRLIKEYLYK
jgi:hypothetical protein